VRIPMQLDVHGSRALLGTERVILPLVVVQHPRRTFVSDR
jgi:hypothetical protein